MEFLHTIIIAIVEGLTEYLPVSSTAHIGFTGNLLEVKDDNFFKMFQVSIQLGAILAVVVAYYKKFFDFSNLKFYYKLIAAVIPALALGYLFNDMIERVLGNQIAISTVLVLGGVVLLFADSWFKNPSTHSEKEISYKNAIIIGFWQCLAMMPGTSRSAASIIGGMTQKLSRKAAAEFSFFLAVPTMCAATGYSLFLKKWGEGSEIKQKGYEMLLANSYNMKVFLLGNVVSFLVALVAIKTFISLLNKYGFRPWGWYRIIVGLVLLVYFYFVS
ncbi:undecaprenyl-diphosphate phosphatase [Riemerella columbipharyngis]|uniref:Undecaprenyl-diphosphatase n=1 Tax=Riemerella columbipharyngis TaxID=1071918 RepID=A0A1G7FSN8_9FLAO|nr:undecaprenyl-diphosphate phosphatase [Riemerella columbipharyngis]SDE78926.1 undecaprenyl-diphosphatase [Riemerella columbipharyngis]